MKPLDDAAEAAEQTRVWLSKRDAAIRQARAEGLSLRAIAAAVGLSHAAVDKIANR